MDCFGGLIALISASLIGSVLGNEIWKTVKKKKKTNLFRHYYYYYFHQLEKDSSEQGKES